MSSLRTYPKLQFSTVNTYPVWKKIGWLFQVSHSGWVVKDPEALLIYNPGEVWQARRPLGHPYPSRPSLTESNLQTNYIAGSGKWFWSGGCLKADQLA